MWKSPILYKSTYIHLYVHEDMYHWLKKEETHTERAHTKEVSFYNNEK